MDDNNKSFDNTGIVLSSRVRLARNINNIPFPHVLSKEAAGKVVQDVSQSVMETSCASEKGIRLIQMKDMKPLERMAMVEKHLISRELAKNHEKSAVLLSHDEDISIMLNEEDHIRLQVIYPGFKIKEAYQYAQQLDDAIEEKLDYAFDPTLGYLTSCPTNVGTGLRASVMLHLPALTITRNINSILNTVSQVGMAIRGLYGEGSNIMGSIYQISNQVTLGLSEEDIVNNLIAVTKKIIDQEILARRLMYEKQPLAMQDEIYRALGCLKYARLLTTSDTLNLLSKVRMGVEMGIIKDIDINKINELLTKVQPATLQLTAQKDLDAAARDAERAEFMRNNI
jgi:protein arginine kinase